MSFPLKTLLRTMPNYSTNTLFIKGDKKELEKFKNENFTSKGVVSFAKSISPPSHIEPQNIILWRTHAWGTKWDVSEDDCTVTEKDGLLMIEFDTAWNPPRNWFWRINHKYLNLSMFMEYRLELSFNTKRYIGEKFDTEKTPVLDHEKLFSLGSFREKQLYLNEYMRLLNQ